MNSEAGSVGYGGFMPNSLRQRRTLRPRRNSQATRHTGLGFSPGLPSYSKSTAHSSAKGRWLGLSDPPPPAAPPSLVDETARANSDSGSVPATLARWSGAGIYAGAVVSAGAAIVLRQAISPLTRSVARRESMGVPMIT